MSLISGFVKSLSKLSMIGRALMLPISLLPAAGLLLAFGDKFHLPLMMNAGGVIFDNLPMLFAIGSAVGLASESGIAALSAAVSVFVTNITINTVLSITPEMASQGGKYAMVVGIPTLQMGVFGGLICGILAAWCYNRFHTMQLPEFLGFFSGKRFVAIATAFLSFLMGLLLPYVWQHIQAGIDALSVVVNGDNQAASTFIFGLVERALIPLGLHHIWYPSFWYSFGDYTTQAGQVIHGDQTIWFKMLEEGVKSFSSDTYQNAGKFMQGEFPLMLFALPAACLAMYHEAHTKNKKIAAGILFSAALTCFLTGITEPVEFTFIFVAPILYVFNAIMAGLACGEPNPLGWEILRNCATQFISCQDSVAALGMRVLGNPYGNDPRIISGESGAVGLGVLAAVHYHPQRQSLMEKLALNKDAVVLVISTEGDTDVKHYREVVWEGKHAVAP